MPHSVTTRNLGRSQSWRRSTVQSLTQSLLKHERVTTTWARAKETQRLAERLITLGKDGTLPARRRAISLINDPQLVRRLFSQISPRFASRSGGYTRVIHAGFRSGDGAQVAVLELVELSPDLTAPTKPKGKEKERTAPEEKKTPEKPKAEKPKVEKPKGTQGKPKGFMEGLRRFFKGRGREKE